MKGVSPVCNANASIAGRSGWNAFLCCCMNTKIKNLYKSKRQVFLIVAIFSFLIILPAQKVWASEITGENIIQLVNKERISQGLNSIIENSVLSQAAENKINDMIKNDYFAHTSPSGVSPWHWIENSGYDYKYAGENLAINFTTAESQHKAWMESETHRKNILNPSYQEIGIAVAKGKVNGSFATIVVQFFGTQMNGIFQPTSANKPLQEEVVGERSVQKTPEPAVPVSKPLLGDVSLKDIQPEKSSGKELICKNGLCYFNQSNSWLYAGNKVSEEIAWLVVVMILFLSIIINALMLSKKDNPNPFIAANTVILLIVLTSVVFWKI